LRGAASTRQILPRGGAKNLPAPRSRMITAQNKAWEAQLQATIDDDRFRI
jgi:hypothetical protein